VSPEFRAAKEALATHFGRTGVTLPDVLTGFFVQ
jgi:hypothetical protein